MKSLQEYLNGSEKIFNEGTTMFKTKQDFFKIASMINDYIKEKNISNMSVLLPQIDSAHFDILYINSKDLEKAGPQNSNWVTSSIQIRCPKFMYDENDADDVIEVLYDFAYKKDNDRFYKFFIERLPENVGTLVDNKASQRHYIKLNNVNEFVKFLCDTFIKTNPKAQTFMF